MRQIMGCAWCRAHSLVRSAGLAGASAVCQALFRAQSRADRGSLRAHIPQEEAENEQGNRESCQLLINAMEKNIAG